MKRCNSNKKETPCVAPKRYCRKKDRCTTAITHIVIDTPPTIRSITATATRNADAVSGETAVATPGHEFHHATGRSAQPNRDHQSGLERVARATKLCDASSNVALLNEPNFPIVNPHRVDTNDTNRTETAILSKAEVYGRLCLGEQRRSLLRLRVFVNSLVELTLGGLDHDVNISYVRSAIQYIFKLLPIVHGSIGNCSELPKEMWHLLDEGLKSTFALAESNRDVPATILQNVDILVLDDFGREALRSLAVRNSNFAAHLQSHLIRSIVETGVRLQQHQQQLTSVGTGTTVSNDESGSEMNVVWEHRHHYQSCAMLLLSTVLHRKCSTRCGEANDIASITNSQSVQNARKATSDSSSSSDQSKPSSKTSFMTFRPIHPDACRKDKAVISQRNPDTNAIDQLGRLQLCPDLFPTLVIFKDKIIEYFDESRESVS